MSTIIGCTNAQLDILQGATTTVRYEIKDENNAAVDLTGATVAGRIVDKLVSPPTVLLDLGPFLSVVAPATDGIVELKIPDADSQAYVDANGQTSKPYDILLTLASADTFPIAAGQAVSKYTATAIT